MFPETSAIQPRMRLNALRSLCPVLQLHTIVSWNRAVGRVLDVGPSQLHAMYALYQINNYRLVADNSAQRPNSQPELTRALRELAAILAEAVGKLKTGHLEVLCLCIAGISEAKIATLRGSFVTSPCVPQSDAVIAPLSAADADFLLTCLTETINQEPTADGSLESGSTKAVRTTRSAAGGARRVAADNSEESNNSTSFDKDHCIKLIALLRGFLRASTALPANLQQQMVSTAFVDLVRMEELLSDVLLNEDLSSECAERVLQAVLVTHRDLCLLLLSPRAATAPAPAVAHLPTYLVALWDAEIHKFSTVGHSQNISVAFHDAASGLRSLYRKATDVLQGSDFSEFTKAAAVSLAQVSGSALHATPKNAPLACTVGDVCVADEAAWLDSAILDFHPECFALYLSLFLLSDMYKKTGDGEDRARMFATKQLLLARALVREVGHAVSAALPVINSVRLVSTVETEVIGANCHKEALHIHSDCDISDPVQRTKLLQRLILAVKSHKHFPQHTRVVVRSLVSLVRVLSVPATICADDDVSKTVNAELLRIGLSASSHGVHASLDTDVALLTLLQSLQEYDTLVDYLVLDMMADRAINNDHWREDARIIAVVDSLPVGSPWRRQVRFINQICLLSCC